VNSNPSRIIFKTFWASNKCCDNRLIPRSLDEITRNGIEVMPIGNSSTIGVAETSERALKPSSQRSIFGLILQSETNMRERNSSKTSPPFLTKPHSAKSLSESRNCTSKKFHKVQSLPSLLRCKSPKDKFKRSGSVTFDARIHVLEFEKPGEQWASAEWADNFSY